MTVTGTWLEPSIYDNERFSSQYAVIYLHSTVLVKWVGCVLIAMETENLSERLVSLDHEIISARKNVSTAYEVAGIFFLVLCFTALTFLR